MKYSTEIYPVKSRLEEILRAHENAACSGRPTRGTGDGVVAVLLAAAGRGGSYREFLDRDFNLALI